MIVVPLVVIAFAVRTLAVLALRRRRPSVAEQIDRWWVWAPLVTLTLVLVVAAIVLTVADPLLGIGATAVAAAVGALTFRHFFLSESSIGSPFRPRSR